MSSSLLTYLSDETRERVLLENGILLVSNELKGTAELLSFSGYIRRYGIQSIEWLSPEEFTKRKRFHASDAKEYQEADVQEYAKLLFQQAYEEGASDIHIINEGAYGLIRFRRLGLLKDHAEISAGFAERLIATIYSTMSTAQSDGNFTPSKRQDARIAKREWLPSGVHSIRVHTEPLQSEQSSSGVGTYMPLRLLYDRTNASGTLEERTESLGFDSIDAKKFRFLTQRTGLTIISGPTGHGKSTLLKHLMEGQTISNPEKGYLSLEDPVEYPMWRVQQVLVSTKTTNDPLQRGRAYMDALAGAMRSDPDVIMIGEIRYPEAAAAAIDMALTGHSVWATIHANNAFGIIRRMVSLLNAANYAEPLEYLCDHNVIAGLVYQRLLPILCPHCKILFSALREDPEQRALLIKDDVKARLYSSLSRKKGQSVEKVALWNPHGCEHCKQLGIVGQTVAAEVIVTDDNLLGHLRKGDYNAAEEYWLNTSGGRTYVQHAVEHINNGIVDPTLAEIRLGVPLNYSQLHQGFTRDTNLQPGEWS